MVAEQVPEQAALIVKCADGAVTAYPLPDPPPPGEGDKQIFLPQRGEAGRGGDFVAGVAALREYLPCCEDGYVPLICRYNRSRATASCSGEK